jgi:hypothetical protein
MMLSILEGGSTNEHFPGEGLDYLFFAKTPADCGINNIAAFVSTSVINLRHVLFL